VAFRTGRNGEGIPNHQGHAGDALADDGTRGLRALAADGKGLMG
jgi:hypothetical protein